MSLHNYVTPEFLAQTGFTALIESALGGAYIHVYGAQTANGTNISTWQYVKQANLEWTIKPSEDAGYFYIVTALDRHHDHVVHQHGANHENNGNITLWDRVNSGNTKVRFQNTGDGFYHIIFQHSNKGVHVLGATTTNNTNITQWDVQPSNNLKWRFALAPKNPSDFVDKPIPFMLESGVNGWYVHVYGASTANNTNISAWSHVNQDNLKWYLKSSEVPGFYYVVTALDRHHDHVIHQLGATHENDGNITLWERVNSANTQIRFEDAGDGYFRLLFRHSNKGVHLHGGVGGNNANISQWDPIHQRNLIWRFLELRS